MLDQSKVTELKEGVRPIEALIKEKDYKGLADHLKEGISGYLESDMFKGYLDFVSSFHTYSSKNVLLILAQNPNASYVAGFNTWKKMERYVKKGEKALYIYAPVMRDKLDKEGNKVTDANGEIQKEISFFLTPVFDASQTSGERELPKPVYELEEDLQDGQTFTQTYKALMELSPVPLTLEPMEGEASGYYSPSEKKIVVKENMGEVMTIRVMIHELTHALLHPESTAKFADEAYSRQEFEAESVTYIVTNHLGIDTSDYSFGYLSSWTDQGNNLEDLTESLETITTQAKQLIELIDTTLEKIYTLDAPENKFEERVAIARSRQTPQPREPRTSYAVEEPKAKLSQQESLTQRLDATKKRMPSGMTGGHS